MNYWSKTSIAFLILLFGQGQAGWAVDEMSQPIQMAVGPVPEGQGGPVYCGSDGICNINGCQNNPDPDCSKPPIPLSSGAVVAVQKSIETLKMDGRERSFIVYEPKGVRSTDKLPVVIMFHGSGGDGEKFYNMSGWKEKADRTQIVTVFPSSAQYSCVIKDGKPKRDVKKWNEDKTELCPGAPDVIADDVKFVRRLVGIVQTKYPTDPKRFYATGFSNGGNFTAKLAMDAPDLFAAIAASAGRLQDTTRVPSEIIPFYLTVGTHNDVERTNGPLPMSSAVLSNPEVEALITTMLDKMRLSPEYSFGQGAYSGGGEVSFAIYNQNRSSQSLRLHPPEFRFLVVKGLTHEYANGKNNPAVYADIFWEFFERFARP